MQAFAGAIALLLAVSAFYETLPESEEATKESLIVSKLSSCGENCSQEDVIAIAQQQVLCFTFTHAI